VLSTLNSTPFAWQILATAPISVSDIIGFVGVSICTIFVAGVIAAATFSATLVST